jgi:E3 ubiquitin-protein ligase TRIP12
MGVFVAKALLDSRLIDLPFSTAFLKWLTGRELTWIDLKELSPDFARSFENLIEFSLKKKNLQVFFLFLSFFSLVNLIIFSQKK